MIDVVIDEKVNYNQRIIRSMKDTYIPIKESVMIRKSDKQLARKLLTVEEYYIWDFFISLNPYNEKDERYRDFVLYTQHFIRSKNNFKGWGMSKPTYLKAMQGLIEKGYMKQWEEDPRLFLVYSTPILDVKEDLK